MKKIICILAAVLLLLCAIALTQCRGEEPQETETTGNTLPSSAPSTAPTQTTAQPETDPPTQPAVTEPTQPLPTQTEPQPTETEPQPTETEPVVLYRNPLTGEALAEFSENRPYAIVFNNIKAALPQYGVSRADILCEMLAEGGITRCVGVCYSISDGDTFGSIRSARPYMVSLAQSFDAIFVHAGRSDECQTYLDNWCYDHLDGVHGANAGNYFYRDESRLDAGYSYEHTLFVSGKNILSYAKKLGCTLKRSGGVSYGWSFGDGGTAGGSAAGNVKVYFNMGSSATSYTKYTSFVYDPASGLYAASQYGAAYKDAATGRQLQFRNLLVLRTAVSEQGDEAGHLNMDMTGSGTGYYFCDGKVIAIKWSRISTTSPYVFTTGDGAPITLGVGKTYMAIIPTKGIVTYS